MSLFPLNSETIEVRGKTITVRELTYKEKSDWVKRVEEDQFCAPAALVAIVVTPSISEEEAAGWPAQIIEQIVDVARRVSGFPDREPDSKNDSRPSSNFSAE